MRTRVRFGRSGHSVFSAKLAAGHNLTPLDKLTITHPAAANRAAMLLQSITRSLPQARWGDARADQPVGVAPSGRPQVVLP